MCCLISLDQSVYVRAYKTRDAFLVDNKLVEDLHTRDRRGIVLKLDIILRSLMIV